MKHENQLERAMKTKTSNLGTTIEWEQVEEH